MSQPGWYPDPGGSPGRYRYWDGRRWSDELRDAPAEPARRRGGPAVMIAVFVLALVVIAALSARLFTDAPRTTADGPLPTSTVSGGDDRSPTAMPSSAAPTPTATLSGLEDCPVGNPNARAERLNDPVFVYGGNLTITRVGEFEAPGEEPRMSFAWDVSEQIHIVSTDPGWIAQFALGQLRGADGFTGSARQVAVKALQCMVTSRMYSPYEPTAAAPQVKALTVSGRAGVEVRTRVSVNKTGLPFAGDDVTIVVVPDGQNWGLYFSAIPTGDATMAAIAERTVESLRAH